MDKASTVLTRTAVILDAVRKRLEESRASIDRAEDLGEVTLTIRLNAGTTHVRSVGYSEERINRRAPVVERRIAAGRT